MLQGICWDLDGTLVNYQIDYIRVRTITKKFWKRMVIPQIVYEWINSLPKWSTKHRSIFRKNAYFPKKKLKRFGMKSMQRL